MADDEFVIGFSDSEWTGIAPMLEEDVAMSSLAQDELGHAQALYQLLAQLRDDGRDADAIAYDRTPDEYRHARLLDHGRGDWAMAIARRYLYDTADAIRLGAVASSSFGPLRELVDKIRREERYHVMHATAWFERLADRDGEPRNRLLAALGALAPDAATVFTPLAGMDRLVEAGAIEAPMAALEARWRAQITPLFVAHGLPMPPTNELGDGRTRHGDPFRWLWNEFTAVRREDPVAVW
jgi:ring-1,2-phenylacetyl-CoA epoxidase subunit PaaC